MARLSATKVKALKKPGRYGDGAGLFLVIRPSGSKSWVQRIVVDGKRRDLGLGGFPALGLKEARERAAANRIDIATGGNPVTTRRKVTAPTFENMAERYITVNTPRWRHWKTSANWMQCFERYAFPVIGALPINRIERGLVLQVLEPIWTVKPAIARKLRQRIRAVFGYAMAHGHIESNPAGEAIDAALPSMPAVKAHFRALPYEAVGDCLKMVEASNASLPVKCCFAFTVLTATRSGEARGATWDEVDLESATWTIPGDRMKAGHEHRVPLSQQALEVLRVALPMRNDSNLIFPSTRTMRPLSDMALTKLLRDLGMAGKATVHGFRTSFKTWCMEQTNTPWAVGEAALAHTLGNSTEAAYARSDLFQKRRSLMQEWADFVYRNVSSQ